MKKAEKTQLKMYRKGRGETEIEIEEQRRVKVEVFQKLQWYSPEVKEKQVKNNETRNRWIDAGGRYEESRDGICV